MDKEVVVHLHNGVLLSYKKNAFESVLMKWMKLEPIIQSEVSQKEKHITPPSLTYLMRKEIENCDMQINELKMNLKCIITRSC